jgi:DNA polymerase-3 subunit epsilon
MKMVAIDFETADYGADSACAVGMVAIESGQIAEARHIFIRPPRSDFRFTHIHGITWPDVEDAPDFAGVWGDMSAFLGGADFLLAHNAGFDRAVLHACCRAAGLEPPSAPFVCTVRLARAAWNIRPTRLPDVCRHLVIPLRHHEALSDATACAEIALAAIADGVSLEAGRIPE